MAVDNVHPLTARELEFARTDDEDESWINPTEVLRAGQRYLPSAGDDDLPQPSLPATAAGTADSFGRYFSAEEMTRRVMAASLNPKMRFITLVMGWTNRKPEALYTVEAPTVEKLEEALDAAKRQISMKLTTLVLDNERLGRFYDIAIVLNKLDEWRKLATSIKVQRTMDETLAKEIVLATSAITAAKTALETRFNINQQQRTPLAAELFGVLDTLKVAIEAYCTDQRERQLSFLISAVSRCIAVATQEPTCEGIEYDVRRRELVGIFASGVSCALAVELATSVQRLCGENGAQLVESLGRFHREAGIYGSAISKVRRLRTGDIAAAEKIIAEVVEKMPRFWPEFLRFSTEAAVASIRMTPALTAGVSGAYRVVATVVPDVANYVSMELLMTSEGTMAAFAQLTANCMTRIKYASVSPTPAAVKLNKEEHDYLCQVFAGLRYFPTGGPTV